jgi:acyl-CoA synthetase (AMP-forming)/AMP-acid ligase II
MTRPKDYIVLMLALLKIAVPFALISCFSTPFELKHALKVTKSTRLFSASHLTAKALPVIQEAGIAKTKVYTMNGNFEGHESLEGFVQKTNSARLQQTNTRIVPKDTLAFLFFSSGTTGLPKGGVIRPAILSRCRLTR